jgi:hypothetical protein
MMTDEELVDKIKSGDFDRKQLENLYANALERDRDSIAEAAKAALQEVDPRSYKRKYIKPIKDKVAQIVGDIATAEGWDELGDNAVSNGIKSSAALVSGENIAESSFSYKHPSWKKASTFYVTQADEESAVGYKVLPHNAEEQTVDTREEAIVLFKQAIKV